MTAKEKAIELFNRYNRCNEAAGSFITRFQVKQCALIAVDEIQHELTTQFGSTAVDYQRECFWQQVKEEIELL